MICGAPNDKLLDDGISVEVYHCEREAGHDDAHWAVGRPPWLAYDPPTEEDLAKKWHAVALQDALPDDAADVAYTLEHGPDPDDSPEEKAETFVRAMARAIAILRGEP